MATGDNAYGHLGNGTIDKQLTFAPLYKDGDLNQPFINPMDSDFNWSNGAVIDTNGKLWLSGDNSYGQLGNGATSETPQLEFKMIVSIDGDSNYQVSNVYTGWKYIIIQMGNNLYGSGYGLRFGMSEKITTFTRIPLPEHEKIIKNEAGDSHFCVLMESGKLYLNGLNTFGQLGNDGNPGSWTTPVLSDVKDFSIGYHHTLVLMIDGSLLSTGRNTDGQLGLGALGQENVVDVNQATFQTVPNTPNDIISIQAGAYHSSFLTSTGKLYFTGRDTYGEFGDGPSNSERNTFEITHQNIKDYDTGYHHSMIVTNDNKILMFGRNSEGQLSTGYSSIHYAYSPQADRTYQFSNNPQISNPPAIQNFLLIYFSM